MPTDRSGAGFWPDGFWSAAAQAGERARRKLERERRARPRERCGFCNRARPAAPLMRQNGIQACRECRETGAADDARYIESAGF